MVDEVRRVNATDMAAALVLATFMVVISAVVRTTQPHARTMTVAGAALLAVGGLVMAWWRTAPLVSYAIAVTAASAYLAMRYPGWPVYVGAIAALVALVSTVADGRWVLPAGGAAGVIATGPPEGWNPARMTGIGISWAVAAILADRFARGRKRLASTEAARLVAEERLRIARELHDVLSHSLAAVTLQAGVGLHVRDNAQVARDALVAIRQISNDALAQARTALATVRDPQRSPGIADLDALAASFRAAGLALSLHIGSEIEQASPETSAATYRIVQEALTNVARHAAPGSKAEASVFGADGWLDIEVSDDGRTAPQNPPGHGMRGMAERAFGLGGSFAAAYEPGRGFMVRARLPLAFVE
jgi:signal transduction histidine kinase